MFVLMYLDEEIKLYMITQQGYVAVGNTPPPPGVETLIFCSGVSLKISRLDLFWV